MNLDTFNLRRVLLAVFLMTTLLVAYNELFTNKGKVNFDSNLKTQPSVSKVIKNDIQNTKQITNILTNNIFKTIKQKNYIATFDLNGGQIHNIALTNYQTPILFFPELTIESRDRSLPFSTETNYYVLNEDENSICFQANILSTIQINQCYQVDPQLFSIQHKIEFKNLDPITKFVSFDIIMKEREYLKNKDEYVKFAFRAKDKYNYFLSEDLKKPLKYISSNPDYIAFNQRYFLTAMNTETFDIENGIINSFNEKNINYIQAKLSEKTFAIKPGEIKTFQHTIYAGPKKADFLKRIDKNLKENIDYGWFGSISQPLLFLLVWINGFVKNFGISIVGLTVFVKIITFPLTQKSFSAQQQMKKIMPKLKQLQEKYAHDKTMLGQKQMELYKNEGINPMSGCFPVLIQMPIWFALYQMLGNSVELYEQPFYFWIKDLTHPDPLYVLPLVMGASMLISQWLMPPTFDESNAQMKYALWIMPVFLTIVMLNLPSGLSIYMVTNNLLTIIHQIYVKRRYGEI